MATFNEPLGLPQGSVRAILALVIISGFVISIMFSYSSEVLATLAGTVAAFYFLERKNETNAAPRSESELLVEPQNGEEPEAVKVISGNELQ